MLENFLGNSLCVCATTQLFTLKLFRKDERKACIKYDSPSNATGVSGGDNNYTSISYLQAVSASILFKKTKDKSDIII